MRTVKQSKKWSIEFASGLLDDQSQEHRLIQTLLNGTAITSMVPPSLIENVQYK